MIIPAVKITGATHEHLNYASLATDEVVPDHCSSLPLPSANESETSALDDIDILPISIDPELQDLDSPDEVEFDQFLMDAAEWL